MLTGLGFTSFYIIASVYWGMEPWTFGVLVHGVNPQGIGALGMVANFLVTFTLTPFFPEPSSEVKHLIDSVRKPEIPSVLG